MFNTMLRNLRLGGVWVALSLASTMASAELVFTSAPRGSEEVERALYEPIAETLSQWLGTRVVYEFPKDFTSYSFAMRDGKYDMLIDGPHLSQWRVMNLQHQALVNLPSRLSFVVLTNVGNAAINSTQDLINRRVCAQAPPQLGTLLLWYQYNNPTREPILQAIRGEGKVYEGLKDGSCETAVLRNSTYLNMAADERARYKMVYSTRPVPNMAFTVSPNVTPEQRRILLEKLTNPQSASIFQPFFQKFDASANRFEQANPSEYEGLDLVLKEMSFGW